MAAGLDDPPTDEEIRLALCKLHETAPGISGLPARAWTALCSTAEGFALVRQIVLHFWDTGTMPAEWESGLLKILFKKGDKSMPGNYRGIMLLDVANKIIANAMRTKLQVIKESTAHLDHEPQCGFRSGRGCADASFTLKQLVRKRREHGIETWLLFVDLVKAFDRVPRTGSDDSDGLLWRVLLKQGVPPKLVLLLKALHRVVLVEFEVDGVMRSPRSSPSSA